MRDITCGGGGVERERGVNIFVLKMFRDLYNLSCDVNLIFIYILFAKGSLKKVKSVMKLQ